MHSRSGTFIGDGERVVDILFSDGKTALVSYQGVQYKMPTKNFTVDKVRSPGFKLEGGRFKRKVDCNWEDLYPITVSAKEQGDVSVAKYLRDKAKDNGDTYDNSFVNKILKFT